MTDLVTHAVTFDNGSDMYLTEKQLKKMKETIGTKGYFVEGIEPREPSKELKRHNLAFSSLVGAMNAKQMGEDAISVSSSLEESIMEDLYEGLMEILD
ncbi:hypothetical protein KNU84_gp082 [Bacteriophage DSS3_VP1]|uniref:Uncharacterized protein n=1 Tax=Bacteriophage DSS3_VP1 TaxID=2664196 RepID=A0A7S5FQH3_9CAUD|nr:hypothetical protein KNU84_gp082 [Bacteriophage DSS3_VP1]QGH74622.1 hypothetical protein DSS3VP1_00054 [Bacteriophage DSS3_VP1]